MPAVSEKMRKLFAIALQMKRKAIPYRYSPQAARLAKTLTEEKLREYAGAPIKRRK